MISSPEILPKNIDITHYHICVNIKSLSCGVIFAGENYFLPPGVAYTAGLMLVLVIQMEGMCQKEALLNTCETVSPFTCQNGG